jgi:Glycosyltransferase
MKKSYIASFFAYIEAIRWSKNNIEPYVDTFICPSNFIADKMIQTGYNKDKICVLCNFIDFKKYNNIYKVKPKIREQAYCYIGRLSEEKGINQLLDVAKSLPYKLYVAGKGPLKDSLEKEYSYKNIIFLGELTTDQIYNLLSTVKCSVMPSVWYENNPLSVIESLCMGTPVLGANIGGIPELINADNGLLFAPNNPNDLREKIVYLFNKYVFCNDKIQATSLSKFSSENYYNKLTGIYNDK